jgi:hypothetical protein
VVDVDVGLVGEMLRLVCGAAGVVVIRRSVPVAARSSIVKVKCRIVSATEATAESNDVHEQPHPCLAF